LESRNSARWAYRCGRGALRIDLLLAICRKFNVMGHRSGQTIQVI
jgi:hypothetical protein